VHLLYREAVSGSEKTKNINIGQWIQQSIGIAVVTASESYRVTGLVSASRRIVVTEIVVARTGFRL